MKNKLGQNLILFALIAGLIFFFAFPAVTIPPPPKFQGGPVTSPILLPDGLSTAPSSAFSNESTLGIYRPGAGLLSIMGGNVGIGTTTPGARLSVAGSGAVNVIITGDGTANVDLIRAYNPGSSGNFRLGADANNQVYFNWGGTAATATIQTMSGGNFAGTIIIQRAGGNILLPGSGNWQSNGNVGIGTTTPDGQLSTGLPNGQQISYKSLTELTTIAAAATTVTTISIPANVIVKAVSVRVTTAIPTATSFTVIGNTSLTAFNTVAVAVAAGSTDKGNLNCPYNNGAAQTIRITPNLTPADASGRVRVTLWYEDCLPGTS